MIDFSIIIPAKNEEHNIKNCLESIFAVDYNPAQYEVIVVDNGSTDQTVAMAKELGARTFIQPDLTISGLRNYGSAAAKGKVLVFLDADCTAKTDWLTEAARYLEASDVACFGSPPIVPDAATWVQKAWYAVRKRNNQVETVEWLESMNMFIPKQQFDQVHGFNEDLVTCEDYDLSVRLKPFGRILSDVRIVAVHHGEAANIKHFFWKEYWRATSNVARFKSRDFNLRELPSILIPPFYLFLACLFVLYLMLFGLFDARTINTGWLILLAVWQLPIVLLSAWKIRYAWNTKIASQLLILLNVYFLARGLSFLLEIFRNKVEKA